MFRSKTLKRDVWFYVWNTSDIATGCCGYEGGNYGGLKRDKEEYKSTPYVSRVFSNFSFNNSYDIYQDYYGDVEEGIDELPHQAKIHCVHRFRHSNKETIHWHTHLLWWITHGICCALKEWRNRQFKCKQHSYHLFHNLKKNLSSILYKKWWSNFNFT